MTYFSFTLEDKSMISETILVYHYSKAFGNHSSYNSGKLKKKWMPRITIFRNI